MIYTFTPVTGDQIVARAADLLPIYRACFSEPPWDPALARFDEYPQQVARHMATPGAHGILAESPSGLAAAIYGWPSPATMPAATAFDHTLLAAVPADLVARLTAPGVVVVELMVDPAHRRKGLATSLLRSFVEPWPQAWLCTHRQAPAGHLYEREGWQRAVTFSAGTIPFVIYTHGACLDHP
jgi:GNAT superfamily N-acetyltransferase